MTLLRLTAWCVLGLHGTACVDGKDDDLRRSGVHDDGQPVPFAADDDPSVEAHPGPSAAPQQRPKGPSGDPPAASMDGGDEVTALDGGTLDRSVKDPTPEGGTSQPPMTMMREDAGRLDNLPMPEQEPLPVTEAETAAIEHVEAFNVALRSRYVNCFNYTASTIEMTYFDFFSPAPMASLRAGLVRFESDRAGDCLAQLSQVDCLELVENRLPEACELPWVGTVPPGGFCLDSVDCADSSQQCAVSSHACGKSCEEAPTEPPPAPDAEGDPCGPIDNCVEGTFCKPNASDTFDGQCQLVVSDQPCTGSWECPWPYTCVEDAPGQGACAAGRRNGEACVVRAFPRLNGWTDHDCAATNQCETAEGASTGTCVAAAAWRGATPLGDAYREVPEGSFCELYPEPQGCGFGRFCSVAPELMEAWNMAPSVELLPDLTGVCHALLQEGEACDSGPYSSDTCVPAAICQDGACTHCP